MASRFWVGGTGTWDSSSTTHWASTTGGASGASAPTSADTVTFDGNSGGGTVTVNLGGSGTFQSITMGAFTGTLDFSVNNDSVTLTASTGFSGAGVGTRTLKLGSGTFTLSAPAAAWNFATSNNLTLVAGTSRILFSSTSPTGTRTFSGGGRTYANLEVAAHATGFPTQIGDANTFASITINATCVVLFPSTVTTTVTDLTATGTSSNQILLASSSTGANATISASGTVSMSWCGLQKLTGSGTASFSSTSSFDFGGNSNITITAPSTGTSGMLYIPNLEGV